MDGLMDEQDDKGQQEGLMVFRLPLVHFNCINVCPSVDQESHHLQLTFGGSSVERCSITQVRLIDTDTFTKEQPHPINVALLRCFMNIIT